MKKLLAAWLCLAVVACAAGHKATMAPAPEAHTGAMTPSMPQTPEEKRAAITQLSDDITKQQQKQTSIPSAPTPMSAGSQTCTDVCTIKTSICDNTDKICKLADELQPDEWATGKCTDAKQSCTDAKKRCTDCGA